MARVVADVYHTVTLPNSGRHQSVGTGHHQFFDNDSYSDELMC